MAVARRGYNEVREALPSSGQSPVFNIEQPEPLWEAGCVSNGCLVSADFCEKIV